MASQQAEPQPAPEPIRFRPSKKRRTGYRQRTDDDNDDRQDDASNTSNGPPQPRATAADYFDGDDADTSEPAVVKVRNARRARLRGVGFRAGSRPGDVEMTQALVLRDEHDGQDGAPVPGLADRFTHQTGLLSDLNDKHMTEYIESRLSSRATTTAHAGDTATFQAAADVPPTGDADTDAAQPTALKPPMMVQGKLMEVDLPPPLAGTTPRAADRPTETSPRRAVAQAPGPDGKRWRSRKRRGSDDIKRDQLVEQFLHENRLDVYDVPEPQSTAAGEGGVDDGDADERLAEEFRRQFMEDMAARRQKKKKPVQPVGKGKTEDVLKGPKLGGSRNSRAAVRDMLLKKEKETKR